MGLPPGQRVHAGPLPRFGLDAYMRRRAVTPPDFRLRIDGDVERPLELTADEIFAVRSELLSDLHCVTTWSAVGLRWSGTPLRSFWEQVVVPRARPRAGVAHLRVRGLDGYAATIPLEEALHEGAFLADRLDDQPLGHHGAPLRLVLPQLYGYKNVKHVHRIEVTLTPLRPSAGRLLGHPRGRVDLEERSGVGAQRFFRALYRLLLPLFLWRARSLSSRRFSRRSARARERRFRRIPASRRSRRCRR
jgi:DMSO/TMAO reductase YedYZ molybdopterin-dependent catalytic subunit